MLFTAAVIARFFQLTVIQHKFYASWAENEHLLSKTLIPVRGQIFVHENKTGAIVPVVTNIKKDLVFAEPPDIVDKQTTAATLARLLELPRAQILEKISDNEKKWVSLKKELSESQSLAIVALKLSGIHLQSESYRFYPEKNFASQVLGFLGFNGDTRTGRYGIEENYDRTLAGSAGFLSLEKDLKGGWITSVNRDVEAAVDGADIVLTLDRAIQFKAEEILKDTVEQHKADGGSLIVLEPKTGKVLAMASFPNFDPNTFNQVEDVGVFRNRAITDTYEPGSVFKPMTMSAAIDTGAVTPDTTFEDTGVVELAGYQIHNANNKVYGVSSMTRVLEQSINTGAVFAEEKTGKEKFLEYVKRFGFGSTTGITLPAESGGDIRNLPNGGDVHYATASFGQGITVTVLQMAQAYATIANGGKMMKPYIVEKIIRKTVPPEEIGTQEVRQVISTQSANTLGAMLVNVVENGHGKRAAVPGYYIAGKTGTAQVAKAGGGYDPSITNGTFAGFGPAENPRFVIVVKITNPKDVRFAESTAAPAFGEMAKFLVNYLQIPPTR